MTVVPTGLAVTEHELAPGDDLGPYQYTLGSEIWLLVLAGRPTVRSVTGEDQLRVGDMVCFADGPDGAHWVGNPGPEPVKLLCLRTRGAPSLRVFPERHTYELSAPGVQVALRPAAKETPVT